MGGDATKWASSIRIDDRVFTVRGFIHLMVHPPLRATRCVTDALTDQTLASVLSPLRGSGYVLTQLKVQEFGAQKAG